MTPEEKMAQMNAGAAKANSSSSFMGMGGAWKSTKSFLKEANPFDLRQMQMNMGGEIMEVAGRSPRNQDTSLGKHVWKNLTRTEKATHVGAMGGLYAGVIGGLAVGAMSDEEDSMSKYMDYGTQAGGIVSAASMVGNKQYRNALGGTKMGSLVGGAISTAVTAGMQDDDAGAWQRAGVGLGSLAVGSIVGAGIGKAISKYSKPITKVA